VNKRAAIGIAIIAGAVAIAAPIAASLYWAQRQTVDEQFVSAEAVASEVARRAALSIEQMAEARRVLISAAAADPCSETNIRLMRRLTVDLDQLRVIGYVANDHMICSGFGRHDNNTRPGIPLGPVTYRSAVGTLVRTSLEMALIPGKTFLSSTDEKTGYTAVVHKDTPVQVFVDRSDISLGFFSSIGKVLLAGRGHFDPAWVDRLGESPWVRFHDSRYLVVIKRVPNAPQTAAYVAIEKESVERGLRRAAVLMVPVGLAAGLVLAMAVIFITRRQMSMRSLIKGALRRKEFFLAYQPIIELRGGTCVGAEALIRWRRPDGQFVRPDLFIPVAEETGLIHDVTKEVMRLIEKDASRYLKSHPHLHIGINLSSRDLVMEDTAHLVLELIRNMGVKPHNILAEATERGFMQADVARRVMDDIHALGVKIAIDDFGTGYSSLSYLEKFKLDYLKIDKSFVDTMGGNAATSQVALHIIEMAKSLKLEMIAEGVESEAQVKFLQERGVQYAQGYFYAKPMPFIEFAAYVAKTEKLVA
jgi:sensor c-di-GMP phosphodiesterase-like protein